METVKFDIKISSVSEIKIPENLQKKIALDQNVQVLIIPSGEKLYDDWKDEEWNKLSMLNEPEE